MEKGFIHETCYATISINFWSTKSKNFSEKYPTEHRIKKVGKLEECLEKEDMKIEKRYLTEWFYGEGK